MKLEVFCGLEFNLEQCREYWMQLKAAWRLASVSNCVIP